MALLEQTDDEFLYFTFFKDRSAAIQAETKW